MKVLLVSSLERGGPLEQALVLGSGLLERGVEVRATSGDERAAHRFRSAGIEAIVLPQRHGLDLAAAMRLWREMRGADLVHAQDRRSGLWTRLAPDMRSVARVYTVHGLPDSYMPPPLGSEHPPLRDRIAYAGVDSALCRRADAVIIPSETVAAIFRDRLRFPAERIEVVPNGVELPDVREPSGTEVGTLSVLEPVKDIATFLEAASLLARTRPELKFVVFGEGSQRSALELRARQLDMTDRITFAGFVDRASALRRLAVLVLPSVFESAPMTLLEAMASGVPIVASRTGGIPEIAGEESARLVTPGDAPGFAREIAALLDDSEARQALARTARARVSERFTTAVNVDATLAVYEQALIKRRGR